MTFRRVAMPVLVLALLGAGTPSPAPAATGAARAAIDWTSIRFVADSGDAVDAEFGTFEVRENRTDDGSADIELAMVRFASTAVARAAASPIVFLEGAPGFSGIDAARGDRFPLFMQLREVADVIVLDVRGAGRSRPRLDCSERFRMPLLEPLTEDSFLAEARKQLGRCAAGWRRKGVDLDGYNAVQAAEDLEALRVALGAGQLTLWGFAEGTHIALEMIRRYPASVERALLHGVEGPDQVGSMPKNVTAAVRKLQGRIAADPAFGPLLPDLVRRMERLARQYTTDPTITNSPDPFGNGRHDIMIDGFLMESATAELSLNSNAFPFVPSIVLAIEAGDLGGTVGQAAIEVRRDFVGTLLPWTMDCAAGVSAKRLRKIQRQAAKNLTARFPDFPFPDACGAVGVADLGKEARVSIKSDVPVLLVSGTFDGVTPAANAKQVARGFRNSEQLSIVGAAHNDLFVSDDAIGDTLLEFLRGVRLSRRQIVLPPIEFLPVARVGR